VAIYLRIFAFAGVASSIFFIDRIPTGSFIFLILFWLFFFAISGAFAGISYGDIVGKSFETLRRKNFFVTKQFITGVGILSSAFIAKQLLNEIAYPENYQLAFFCAAVFLFIASFGFSMIKENASPVPVKNKPSTQKKLFKEIIENKTFQYLIIISNLAGISFVTIPFLVGHIKDSFSITQKDISNFLFLQILGMIASSFIWKKVIHRFSYKGLMRISISLLVLIPTISLFINSLILFNVLFFIIGGTISSWKIIQEGAIIELSNEENRALYLGMFGTLNFSSIIAPIIFGFLLHSIDISYIFIASSIISTFSFLPIKKLVCPADLNY